MEKNLPITIPPIIGYTIHAYPLSIILNYNKCLPWFYSNYIQLLCNTEFKGNFFDFFTLCCILEGNPWIDSIYPGIPWINRNSIEGYVIDQCNLDIHDLIINSINQSNYIVTFLDEFFTPNRTDYQRKHFFHENLIYGYNLKEKTYDILGFNDLRNFDKSKISFQALEQSVKSGIVNLSYNPIKLLKVRSDFKYELDLELIRDLLLDYLNSNNSSRKLKMIKNPTENCVYGIKVYNEIVNYFQLFKNNSVQFDFRHLHILWEHKKCMLLRVKFISENYVSVGLDEVYSKYLVLERKCLLIRNLFLKYFIAKKPATIEKIILELNYISNMEQEIIPDLILKIENLM